MKTMQPKKEHLTKLKKMSVSDAPMPDDISKWLERLNLLYGIPFNYLVSDERMLPVESFRFFYIDENWMMNLLDGACSLGRNTKSDINHDKTKFNFSDTNRTGFLLRSSLVEGWPGLVVTAFNDQTPLTVLRMERLAKDVLLCIFDGNFNKLEIQEPKESLHLGADEGSAGKYTKELRGLGIGKTAAGEVIAGIKIDVPVRDNGLRVVDVSKLVDNLKQGLKAKGELGDNFTSAELALEMVESARMGVFDNKGC